MENLNLVVKFKLSEGGELCVRGAARIKVDGRGTLMLYDAENGSAETIDLQRLQSLSIQSVVGAGQLASAIM